MPVFHRHPRLLQDVLRGLLSCAMIVLSAAACGGDGGTDLESEGESSIEPITGEWYRPTVATTWQWQLVGTINTGYSVDLYDIDLFDVPTSLIASIQASGKRVICYFSAGSFEDFRSDASSFRAQDLGTPLGDFPDEKWLDIRSASVLAIMEARLDLAVQKGCDGVEPDNMDGYDNDSGFDLTASDQLDFNRTIANEAHERGLEERPRPDRRFNRVLRFSSQRAVPRVRRVRCARCVHHGGQTRVQR